MSLLVVSLASFIFSGFAVAGIHAPDCTGSSWNWSLNTLGQNACTVAAYMIATCNGGSFTINPLASGHSYSGQSGSDDGDLCRCNTIAYSLLSACDACQGAKWISLSEYKHNCTKVLLPSTFPNPVPSGTRVPHWALIDVTGEGTWDATKSRTIGDSPEAGPGKLLGPRAIRLINATNVPLHTTTKTTFSSGVLPPTLPRRSGLNLGALAGAILGGIMAFSAISAAIFYLRRRRLQAPECAAFVTLGGNDEHRQRMGKALSDNVLVDSSSFPETITTPTKPVKPKSSALSELA